MYTRETTDPTALSKQIANKMFQNLNVLAPAKFTRSEKTVNLIEESEKFVLDENENFILDRTATGMKKPARYLQRNLQTPEGVSKLQRKTGFSRMRKTWSLWTNEKKWLELNIRA